MHLKNNLNTKLSRSVANVDINPCPECGAQATYQQNERDGGFYLGCACGLKTGCVDLFTQNDIELIRTQWNTLKTRLYQLSSEGHLYTVIDSDLVSKIQGDWDGYDDEENLNYCLVPETETTE